MIHHWQYSIRRWRALALFGTIALGQSRPLSSATCNAPAALQARTRSNPNSDAFAAMGVWFGNHHESACASQAFEAAAKLQPQSSRIEYLLGLSLYTAGELELSIPPLQRAARLDPQSENAHLLLASALTGLGRTKDAFAEWQAALRIDPHSEMALDGIAKILLTAGDNESIIAQLTGMQLNENLALDLATAYARTGKFDEATTVLIQALKARPESVPLTSLLVSVYVKQLRLADAEEAAKQLAHHNPQNVEAQRVYLQILVFNAENKAAMPLARKMLALAPHDANFLYLNGVIERAEGDLTQARKHLEEAIKLNPNDYATRFNLGCALEEFHEYSAAEVQLKKAIELDSTEPESRFELAKVLRKLGETDEAQEQLTLYQKELKEQSDRGVAAQKSTQAAAAIRAGDKEKAATLYREAIAALPDNAELEYQLAEVLRDLNDPKGAREAFEKAIKIDPGFALAQYALGYLDFREGDMGGAEQSLRQAIKASPGYVQAWIALAATLASESRYSEALQAVDTALQIAPNDSQALELRKKLAAGQAQR